MVPPLASTKASGKNSWHLVQLKNVERVQVSSSRVGLKKKKILHGIFQLNISRYPPNQWNKMARLWVHLLPPSKI
jgi:hypothetical protein